MRRYLNEHMRNLLRLGALIAVALLLGACSLSPDYTRPETLLPGEYQAASAEMAGVAAENREWWGNFNSRALPVIQKLALENNHAFAADRWVLAQAFSQARAARSSLFPSLGASGSGSRRGSEGASGYSVSDSFSGTMQASYELDLWGKNLEGANRGEYRALAGMYAWRGAGLSLESEVALTYFSLLAARENLVVYDSMLANAREVLAYQEKRERLGAVAPLDVVRQRRSVENMEAERISYQIKVSTAQNNLCLLLGLAELPEDLEKLISSEKLQDLPPPAVSAGIPADLLTRRPDVAEAEARLMAANANIGIARAAFLPGISLTVSGGYQSSSLSSLFSPASALYNLGASLVQSIFSGGQLLAQLDEAHAAKEELVERYRQSALAAFWEVSTALEANSLLVDQEGRRGAALAEAAEAYRIARVRYESGAEDFLSVLDAQDAMLSAENSMVQIRLERLNSSVSLFKALGGGWGSEGDMEKMRKEHQTF